MFCYLFNCFFSWELQLSLWIKPTTTGMPYIRKSKMTFVVVSIILFFTWVAKNVPLTIFFKAFFCNCYWIRVCSDKVCRLKFREIKNPFVLKGWVLSFWKVLFSKINDCHTITRSCWPCLRIFVIIIKELFK